MSHWPSNISIRCHWPNIYTATYAAVDLQNMLAAFLLSPFHPCLSAKGRPLLLHQSRMRQGQPEQGWHGQAHTPGPPIVCVHRHTVIIHGDVKLHNCSLFLESKRDCCTCFLSTGQPLGSTYCHATTSNPCACCSCWNDFFFSIAVIQITYLKEKEWWLNNEWFSIIFGHFFLILDSGKLIIINKPQIQIFIFNLTASKPMLTHLCHQVLLCCPVNIFYSIVPSIFFRI